MDRILLLSVLPVEGDLTTLKLVRQARESLSFDEAEHAALNIHQDGQRVVWNTSNERDKDISIGAKITSMIHDRLIELSKQKKLTEQHLPLCEKFEVEG